MPDNASQELGRIVDEMLMLVQESARYHTDADVRSILDEAGRTLVSFHRRLQIVADRYIVAVVGMTNVGKSTLLNALLGSELAPRRNGPCTAAPIEFMFGELRVTAHYRRRLSRPSWNCSDSGAVHERLASLADDSGDAASSEIRKVVVEAPLSLLSNGLIVADTPGFGAAQSADAESSHERSLKEYLNDDVSQVFWIVLADQGIGKREMHFHNAFFGQVCDDVVVTGCEDWEGDDRERFRRRFCSHFGNRIPRFHFVSGLQGLRARKSNDLEGLESAGVPLLESRIRELVESKGRLVAIQSAVVELATDLRAWLCDYRDSRRQRLARWWRPDSWSRWKACLPHNPMKLRLNGALTEIE
ncbi:MAG: dynamin family protein [Phycisphaeraceae bacterium]